MTKGINNNAYACAFDSGPVHAYGFRSEPGFTQNEPGTKLIYSGTKYDGNAHDFINRIVYIFFPNPTFNISTFSYKRFFTRTPRDEVVAALNA